MGQPLRIIRLNRSKKLVMGGADLVKARKTTFESAVGARNEQMRCKSAIESAVGALYRGKLQIILKEEQIMIR
ncbi:hypothetical protein PWYN_03745 [Paenibacillus wynnii]|uniref:Uncharacterized protein n=1 Tax=Paenibacillus wynnii TaxID=268407 RepID=A0A098M7Q3_9BACL|nr:hypothetical protein PWYN_03745 [Paenibacillus wynnii]